MTYKFNIVLNDDEKTGFTVTSSFDVFSANKTLICNYVAELGGILMNPNTAKMPNNEAVEKLAHKLLNLTIPMNLSKKR